MTISAIGRAAVATQLTPRHGSELRCTINIVECLDLEELAATARRLNQYEFVITFAPLPVEGGNGSPVNPLVTFQRVMHITHAVRRAFPICRGGFPAADRRRSYG